jgi:hypothetical protein
VNIPQAYAASALQAKPHRETAPSVFFSGAQHVSELASEHACNQGSESEVRQMDDADIISVYSLEQAIADGVLVKVLEHRWPELSGNKPIVATANIVSNISMAGVMEIWNEYVVWRQKTTKTDDIFVAKMDGRDVWVIEDGQAFTILYPEDY